jgi:hypothetical protein
MQELTNLMEEDKYIPGPIFQAVLSSFRTLAVGIAWISVTIYLGAKELFALAGATSTYGEIRYLIVGNNALKNMASSSKVDMNNINQAYLINETTVKPLWVPGTKKSYTSSDKYDWNGNTSSYWSSRNRWIDSSV